MNKWVSVDEELPDIYGAVLAWVQPQEYNTAICDGTYCTVFMDETETWYDWLYEKPLETDDETGVTVVAWQELPDEYKEEQ